MFGYLCGFVLVSLCVACIDRLRVLYFAISHEELDDDERSDQLIVKSNFQKKIVEN